MQLGSYLFRLLKPYSALTILAKKQRGAEQQRPQPKLPSLTSLKLFLNPRPSLSASVAKPLGLASLLPPKFSEGLNTAEETEETMKESMHRTKEWAQEMEEKAKQNAEIMKEKTSNTAEKAAAKARQETYRAADMTQDTKGKSKERAHDMKEKTKDVGEIAADKGKEETSKAAEAARNLGEKAKQTVQDAWGAAKETSQKIKETVVGKSEEDDDDYVSRATKEDGGKTMDEDVVELRRRVGKHEGQKKN